METLGLALIDNFDLVVAVPDSRSSALCSYLENHHPLYIQVTDEAAAIALSCGFNLASRPSIVICESSGLRRGFESLARLSASHGMHPAVLATRRGGLGDSEWWSAAHLYTSEAVASALGALTCEVDLHSEAAALVIEQMRRSWSTQQRPVIGWLVS